jgi:hypothetical protein
LARDSLSPEGAHQIALTIQAFWRSRGVHGVRVQATRIELKGNSVPANMWQIRSNLSFDGQGNIRTKEDDDEEFDARTHLSEPNRDFAQRPVPRSKQSKPGRAARKAKQ